nr:MAG TPA: hypothetical protein [Caudoviricetes sp.]
MRSLSGFRRVRVFRPPQRVLYVRRFITPLDSISCFRL